MCDFHQGASTEIFVSVTLIHLVVPRVPSLCCCSARTKAFFPAAAVNNCGIRWVSPQGETFVPPAGATLTFRLTLFPWKVPLAHQSSARCMTMSRLLHAQAPRTINIYEEAQNKLQTFCDACCAQYHIFISPMQLPMRAVRDPSILRSGGAAMMQPDIRRYS